MISDKELFKTLKNALHKDLLTQPIIYKTEKELEKILNEINNSLNPYNRFKKWKQSQDGVKWKKETWMNQGKRCANPKCNAIIPLKGSHIDHIQPISKRPDLATDPKNLRILCPECNMRKGASTPLG